MANQLQTVAFTSLYGQQPTGTPVGTSNKIPADVICLDLNGMPIGTLGSPSVTTSTQNALGATGKSFAASSGHLGVTLVGNARVYFSNPVNSGVMAAVTAIAVYYSGAAAIYPTSFIQPTAGLPTKAGITGNVLLGGAASNCTLTADTNSTALSGGTPYIPLSVPNGRTVFSQLSMYIPSGFSLGFNFPLVAGSDFEMTLYFNEV
jgi:hypothetical protein